MTVPAPGPATLERAAEVLAGFAVRCQEMAEEASMQWPADVWRGQAHAAYAARVAALTQVAEAAGSRWRHVAEQLWIVAGLLRAEVVDAGAAERVVAALAIDPDTTSALSTKWHDADPLTRRDLAQRAGLEADLVAGRTRRADGLLDAHEAQSLSNARAVDEALDAVSVATLWSYDSDAHDGDGTVVIGVGDVRAADDHVVLVPGVGTEVVDAVAQAHRVHAIVEAAQAHGAEQAAGWFWLGYDTPDGPTDPAMVTTARAQEGGAALARDVARLQSANPGGERWTVVGHSYGSTTLSYAATGAGVDVDAVVLAGSPGAGRAEKASDLGVGEVFVARDSRDLVAMLGDEGWAGKGGVGLGRDPSAEEFGAVRIRAERPDRDPWPGVGAAHSGYFTPGSASLSNIGAVVAGAYDRVEVAEPSHDPWWGWPTDPEWKREG